MKTQYLLLDGKSFKGKTRRSGESVEPEMGSEVCVQDDVEVQLGPALREETMQNMQLKDETSSLGDRTMGPTVRQVTVRTREWSGSYRSRGPSALEVHGVSGVPLSASGLV